MKLFADECVYAKTVAFLKNKGYKVRTVQEEGLLGCKDPELIRYSVKNNFVLLTRDKDFKDILKYPPTQHAGIIVLEINPKNTDEVHHTLSGMLKTHKNLNKVLAVVDRQKYKLIKA